MTTTLTPVSTIAEDLVAAVGSELRRIHAPAGSCILAAAIATDVLGHLGHDSEAVTTSILVMSPRAKAAYERGKDLIDIALAGHYVAGCGLDRYGYDPATSHYDGHLLVRTAGTYLDITRTQFNSPADGVTLQAGIFHSDELDRGDTAFVEVNGSLVRYEPIADVSYRQTGAWSSTAAIRRSAKRVVRRLGLHA